MSTRSRIVGLLFGAFLSQAPGSAAQQPGQPVPLPGVFDGGYLVFQSRDSAFKYWLDGRIMLDAAWYGGSRNTLSNGTAVRRARIGVKATLFTDWLAEIDVDFAGDAVEMKDLWIGYGGLRNALFRFGNMKEPFSLETLTSSKFITFMERSWADNLSPDRHIGAAASFFGKQWQVTGGIFGQGPPDVDETGVDEATGFTGRATVAPILRERRLLHVGVSASRREPDAGAGTDANQQRFRARPETMVNRARFLSTGRIRNVDYTMLYNGELAAVAGPFSVQGEYTRAVVHRLEDLESATFEGGYGMASFFLTGESRPYLAHEGEFDRVIPRSKHGALEVAARVSTLDLNDRTAGVDILGGKGVNYTVAANWYVNSNFKFSLNYVRVTTDENAVPDQGTEFPGDNFNILQIRWALAF
ncbi:MAG TPA: porin [Gemmatimonadales bacterium]